MPSADLSQRFQEVLANYLEAKERGERVDPQALVRAHPELAAELNEFFANEKQFASAAGITANAPAPRRTPIGQRVGEYEILGEIARGGMGVVYRARHLSLQRLVALKMMLGGEFAGREGLRRFNEEAKVVAELDHPNIVPIYETGAHDGQAFYAMKLIDGPSLKQEIAWYVGKPEQAARLIIQVARAVHHAHQRGVLHRDLKPGNILLQTAREEKKPVAKKGKDYPVSGVPPSAIGDLQFAIPFVADFGLAKRFRADGKASHSTAVVGTAAYMAPEQATGKAALTVAADVYSLGAILYELLTGNKPFAGANPMEVLLKVVKDEPASPRDAQPGLDADLAQICLKCLRKEPQARYASAEALAEELVQWLEGETLTVRAPTFPERSWRWCPTDLAQFSPGGRFVATTSANSGVRLWRADTGNPFCPALPHAAKVAALAFSRNDQWLATAGDDHMVRLWNLAWADRDKTVALPKNKGTLLSGSPDGRHALLAQAKSTVIWDLDQGRAVGAALSLTAVTPLLTRWSADGTGVAIATAGEVRMWEIPSGKAITPTKEFAVWAKKMLEKKQAKTTHLLDCDGQRLAVWKTKGTLEIQDVSGEMAKTLKLALAPDVFRFSPDRRYGAAGFADGSLRLWDLAEGKPATPPFWPGEPIRQIAYSADGRLLASAGTSGRTRVWDARTGQALSGDLFAAGPLVDLAFRADAGMLHAWTESRLQRWSLQPQPGNAADLLLRTRRGAGQDIDPDSGVLVPLDAAALKELWQRP